MSSLKSYTADDLRAGDWIKFKSGYYGGGRLAEVHAVVAEPRTGDYVVTTEGHVLLRRIIEVRRLPTNVLVLSPTKRS